MQDSGKPISFSRHALERMEQRGITREQVRAVIRGPNRRLREAMPGRIKICARLKDMEIVVVYANEPGQFRVITAWGNET